MMFEQVATGSRARGDGEGSQAGEETRDEVLLRGGGGGIEGGEAVAGSRDVRGSGDGLAGAGGGTPREELELGIMDKDEFEGLGLEVEGLGLGVIVCHDCSCESSERGTMILEGTVLRVEIGEGEDISDGEGEGEDEVAGGDRGQGLLGAVIDEEADGDRRKDRVGEGMR